MRRGKLAILLVTILGVLLMSVTTFASSKVLSIGITNVHNNLNKTESLNTLYQKYNLITIKKVPNGIVPIKIESAKQLSEILNRFNNFQNLPVTVKIKEVPWNMIPKQLILKIEREMIKSNKMRLELSNDYVDRVSLHKSQRETLLGTYFNLWADVYVFHYGSFGQIESCYQWVGLTGFTLAVNLTNSGSYNHISNDKQSIYISGHGTLNAYFLIEGSVKLYSREVSLAINYSI